MWFNFLKVSMIVVFATPIAIVPMAYGGGVRGSAELNYATFQAETDREKILDAHHFWQKYSLMYDTSGQILNGRGGNWRLGLGGEWIGLEGDFNGNNSEDRFKPLYEATLELAPGGLPFRLMFSHRDMHRSRVDDNRRSGSSGGAEPGYGVDNATIFNPAIATSILNGKAIETRLTLLAGIKNGSYLGRYRRALSNFPRLLMDYRQVVVKDLKTKTPVHYRERELAFVSLNKKENWVHYRLSDYRDYLAPENNSTTAQYILGTITPSMRRHWIQMTNWIRVSADSHFSNSKQSVKDNMSGEIDALRTSSYGLNVLGSARQTQWQGFSSLRFYRETGKKPQDIQKDISVPVYLHGELDSNTRWRFRFEGEQHDSVLKTGTDQLYSQAQLEAFRRERFQLTTDVSLEKYTGDDSEGNSANLGLEFFSNRAFRPLNAYFLSYDLSYLSSTSTAAGGDREFWENAVKLEMDRNIGSRFTWGVSQGLVYGTGEVANSGDGRIQSVAGGALGGENDANNRAGDIFTSRTKVYAAHVTSNRHSNRFDLNFGYASENGFDSTHLLAQHRYSYNARGIFYSLQSSYERKTKALGVKETELAVRGMARYQPGRALKAEASFDYERENSQADDNTNFSAREELRYSIYKINGLIRKLWHFTQEAEYRMDDIDGRRISVGVYRIGANYYPWQVLALSSEMTLKRESNGSDFMTYDLGCNFRMSKLQMGLTYSYGTLSKDDSLSGDQREQRLEIDIKRVF